MLRKAYRLKSPKLFRVAFKSRKVVSTTCLVVYGLPHKPEFIASRASTTVLKPRFGIIVGTKVHKHAVHRNLIKRRIREIIRKDVLPKDSLKTTKNGLNTFNAFIIVVKPLAIDASYPQIRQELTQCITRLTTGLTSFPSS